MPVLPAALPRRPIPLVTIGFLGDLALLRLQARSFAIHLLPAPGRRILVVNNDNDAAGFAASFARLVLPEYGPHAEAVELLPREAVLAGFDALKGWRRQQLLKWAVVGLAGAPLCLTLDSKNCLLAPWRDEDLFTAEGRIRLGKRRLAENLVPSWRYFVPDGPAPALVSNITTPYALLGRDMAAMLAAIAAREGRPAFEVLAERGEFYEYALYWAHLAACGRDWLYDLRAKPLAAGLWFTEDEQAETILAALESGLVPWLGLHRRVAGAEPAIRARIAALLAQARLFPSAGRATAFMDRFLAA
jgi:hypothetical protein